MAKTAKVKVTKPPVPGSPGWVKQSLLGVYGIVGVALSTFGGFKVPFAESNAKDYWRHALAGIILVLALISGVVSLALYLFNANYFKSQIIEYVKTNNQRDLTLDGDLKVTFFPKLGLDAGKMSISQRNSSKNFASIDSAHFQIAWWPIFLKQLQIEGVTLHGVHANLVRYKNGTSNLDDLFASEGKPSDISFEVDSVKLTDASISLQEEAHGYFISMHNLNLETGKLANATPGNITANFRMESARPRIDTKVKLSTHLLFDLNTRHYELANLEAEMEGDIAGLNAITLTLQASISGDPAAGKTSIDKFSAVAKGKIDNRKLDARLDIPGLKLQPGKLNGDKLTLNTSLIQEDENLTSASEMPAFEINGNTLKSDSVSSSFDLFKSGRTLQGKLSSPLKYNLETRVLDLTFLNSNLTASHPALSGKLAATLNGTLSANLGEQNIRLNLKSKVDDSNLSGQLAVQGFEQPAYSFDLNVDNLNLDRYLVSNWSKRIQDDAQPFDLGGIKNLNLRGKLNAGEFRFANLKMNNMHLELKAEPGSLAIEPFSARLYGGNATGGLSIVHSELPKITFRQKLNNVQINTLFADLLASETKISGKGNLLLDVGGSGENMGAIRRSLSGSASLSLAHGAIAGLNLESALLENKAQLKVPGAKFSLPAKFTESTAFTELKSTFDISDGKAQSRDLLIKSATLSSKGEGDIAVAQGLLNFTLNTSVAANLKRAAHGDIAELKGTSLPLLINGPYASPTITLDLAAAGSIVPTKPGQTAPSKNQMPARSKRP